MYLLVSNPRTSYWTDVEVGGPYAWLHLFPEWKAPLGRALVPQPATMTDLAVPHQAGVYQRAFQNGVVLANLGCAAPCSVALAETMYRLGATGGWDPEVGEFPGAPVILADGAVNYTPVSNLVLDPIEGAVLLQNPPDWVGASTPTPVRTGTPSATATTPPAPATSVTPSPAPSRRQVFLPIARRGG